MKKFLITATLAFASLVYKKRKFNVPPRRAMANFGCGLHCLSGWLNVDGSLTALFGSRKFSFINKILYRLAGSSVFYSFSEYDEIIRRKGLLFYNLKNGVPFKNNSLDVIFTSHFLEHLNEKDGIGVIMGCYRALKPDGIFRILVPDLDFAMGMYKSGKIDEMLRSFFYTSNKYDFHMHKYNYNFKTLKERLEKAGFKSIKRVGFKKGNCPGIDFLDVYVNSLIVECKK